MSNKAQNTLHAVVRMLAVDGRISNEERQFLKRAARHLSLDDASLDMAIQLVKDRKLKFSIPRSEKHQKELLQLLIQASLADGRISPEEEKLLHRVAARTKFADRLDDMIAAEGTTHSEREPKPPKQASLAKPKPVPTIRIVLGLPSLILYLIYALAAIVLTLSYVKQCNKSVNPDRDKVCLICRKPSVGTVAYVKSGAVPMCQEHLDSPPKTLPGFGLRDVPSLLLYLFYTFVVSIFFLIVFAPSFLVGVALSVCSRNYISLPFTTVLGYYLLIKFREYSQDTSIWSAALLSLIALAIMSLLATLEKDKSESKEGAKT